MIGGNNNLFSTIVVYGKFQNYVTQKIHSCQGVWKVIEVKVEWGKAKDLYIKHVQQGCIIRFDS